MLTFNNITADSFAADTQHGAGRRRPRHREALSCNQCRDRKVRCDRKQPCKQCQTRGLSSNCSYGTTRDHGSFSQQQHPAQQQLLQQQASEHKNKRPQTEPPSPSSSTSGESDVRKRLDRIESLLAASASSSSSVGAPETPKRRPSVATTSTPIHINSANVLHSRPGSPLSAKTRFVCGTHWLAVCNHMVVLRAMLGKSAEFASSHRSFAAIKAWTKTVNAVPLPAPCSPTDNNGVYHLLPPRAICENWIRVYFQTYRHVYDIVDQVTLDSAMQSIWSMDQRDNSTLVSIVLLVVCLGMQSDENERLVGRRIAREVEMFALNNSILHKPCVGSMMVLLLLTLIKTLACSDTESLDSLAGIVGLSSQVALAMGLHRDPASFGEISTFHGEIRKRLWGVFFRLNFEYCMIMGLPCSLREEDTTVGLPSNVNLADLAYEPAGSEVKVKELPIQTEATFSIIAAKLTFIAAPLQRAICTGGEVSLESIRQVGEKFQQLVNSAPPHMRPGAKVTQHTEVIQQAFLTVTMHSISLILSLQLIIDSQPDPGQKAHLLNIWDHSLSVIHSFQVLSSKSPEIQTIAYQLLWSDACRAAFSASMVLNRLRLIEMRSIMSTRPQHTLIPFQQSLLKYVTFMSQFWFKSAHLGPVASKNCLILAVVLAVTAQLFAEEDGSSEKELIAVGARSVEQAVDSMKMAMQQRYSFPLSPEASSSSSQMGVSLGRMLSSSNRSLSGTDLNGTWPQTSGVLESPHTSISVTAGPQLDPFVQSIGTTYGHPFISSDQHSLPFNDAIAWPVDPYEFSRQPSIAGLSITEKASGANPGSNPVFMDGLISPGAEWNTTQWIEDMSMQY